MQGKPAQAGDWLKRDAPGPLQTFQELVTLRNNTTEENAANGGRLIPWTLLCRQHVASLCHATLLPFLHNAGHCVDCLSPPLPRHNIGRFVTRSIQASHDPKIQTRLRCPKLGWIGTRKEDPNQA